MRDVIRAATAVAALSLLVGLGRLAPAALEAQDQAAATPAPHANDDCMMCHSDPETTRADGTSLGVDAAKFEASVHGQLGMACVDCHADVATAELPHAEKLARVDCSTCHADASAAFAKSIHFEAREHGKGEAATCVSCHGMHDILPSSDPASRTYALNLPNTCGSCHGNDTLITRTNMQGGNVASQYADSIHGRALKAGLIVAPSCSACHGAHDILASTDPEGKVFRFNQVATCGTCHEGIKHQFDKGRHGQLLAAQDDRAPVCADCHSAHGIQAADTPQWRVDVIRECGTCHVEKLTTYRDTFHGQVTNLGFARVATCADCHGAHAVLPQSDPASPTHPTNRVAMCQQCHAGANENFAQYDPHADLHDRSRNAPLYYTARFMGVLLIGVFTFFGVHTTLWFQRAWREAAASRTPRQTLPAESVLPPPPHAGDEEPKGGER
ncbi:MAG: cytochrome c3 family protein [Vicinamibacteraceae bacterium]|nr:cytochrome c3 family protein [Vicinamibacteraceae bacterium]